MTAGGNSHENIQIQVMDTGCGFSEDILQSLNSAIPLEPQNGHRIGITNAIQRLNLLYGQGEAVITFSNLPSGGACNHPFSLQSDPIPLPNLWKESFMNALLVDDDRFVVAALEKKK